MAPPDANTFAHPLVTSGCRERRMWLRIKQAPFPRSFAFSAQRALVGGSPGIHATLPDLFAVSFLVTDACVVMFRASRQDR